MHIGRWLAGALFGAAIGCLAGCEKIIGLEDSTLAVEGGAERDAAKADGAGSGGGGGSSGAGGAAGNISRPDAAADAEAGACSGLVCNGSCVPNDIHNCGSCGHDCTQLPHVSGAVTCNAGSCSFPLSSCASPWSHCSTRADDGCETDLSKTDNCGGCGKICAAATPVCASSGGTYACATGCPGGAANCDGTCVDTSTSATNCGSCGHACSTAVTHAQAACVNSSCTFQCNTGYTSCAGGCVDEQIDDNDCGGCGATYACAGGKKCSSGSCKCPSGTHECGGTCASNQSVGSCGATSCAMCPGPTAGSGSPSCDGTSCGVSCSGSTPTYCPNTKDCVNTTSDDKNCGGCGMQCPTGKHCFNSQCGQCHAGDSQPCGHAMVGICKPGTQTCQTDGSWGQCMGNQEPKARDCTSASDNDCDGKPDNTIDSVCQCAVNTARDCQTHPGLDGKGICKAGSQTCVAGTGNTTSSWGGCSGSVGPGTETCSPTSGDQDCNGIQGDGPGCFTTYYVFFNTASGSFSCPPKDWLMQTSAQPPVGYTFMTTVKLPASGIPIYSCENGAHPPEYASGDGCGLMPTKQTLLANGSSTNGGNGWVALNYTQVAVGGTVALLPEGDPHCCNCQAVTRRDTTPLYTVPTAP